MKIGQYQLENLKRNRVPFLYLDLREPQIRDAQANGHALFADSFSVTPENVVDFVRSAGVANNHPIVLICENDAKSMAAAKRLEEDSYINVFVLEGGTSALILG